VESIVPRQDVQGYYLSSEYIRPVTKDILLQLLLQVNFDTNLYYHMDLDIGRDAQYHRIGGTYRFYPGIPKTQRLTLSISSISNQAHRVSPGKESSHRRGYDAGWEESCSV